LFKKSTIQLLRFQFSFFLLPVYLFALSFIEHIHIPRAIVVFILLHVLLYPSSNGFNSYMDRDVESIGGIKNPLPPTKELFYITIVMDTLAALLAACISGLSLLLVFIYIVFSRLYSLKTVRLKKYPIIGFLTVVINQGATIFYLVYHSVSENLNESPPLIGLLISSLLIGGFYPITQIYQHKQDKEDGVSTISILLGIKGTFIFCSVMYAIVFGCLFYNYWEKNALSQFYLISIFFAPVIVYFFYWFLLVIRDKSKANFEYTMGMNWLASLCTNLAFITLIIFNYLK